MPNLAMGPIMPTLLQMLGQQAQIQDTQARTALLNQESQLRAQQIQNQQKFAEGLAALASVKQVQESTDTGTPSALGGLANTEMGKPIVVGYQAASQSEKQNRQLAQLAESVGDIDKQKFFEKQADDDSNRARQWYTDGMKLVDDNQKKLASTAGSYQDDGSNLDDVVDTVKSIDPKQLRGTQFNRDDKGNIISGPKTTAAFGAIADKSMSRSEQMAARRESDKIKQDAITNDRRDTDQKLRELREDRMAAAQQQNSERADKRLAIALGDVPGAVPSKDQDKHGDAYLATLSPSIAGEVKTIAEGRMNISAMGYRGAARSAMMERVSQYDPDFDQTQWAARSSTRRDFAAGQAAKNITAINTAIGHLGTMNELATAMNNHDMVAANKVVNTIRTQLGDPSINNYGLAATAVSDEMMRVFRQVGASDAEAARWEKSFKSDLSTGQLKGSMGTAVKLLGSRAEALHDQWTNTMGDVIKAPEVIHPRSQEVLKQLGVKLDVGEKDKPVSPAKAATREQVTSRGVTYEPDKYDYGIDENGNLMRRKK